MPSFQLDNFTDNQAVNPAISTDNDKKLLALINDCVATSEQYRNGFAVMTDSWAQDATKYESLYNGKLYDKRQKLSYECKEDIYRDLVDFNASLLTQFDFKEYIRQIGNENNSIPADMFTRFLQYADKLNDARSKEEDMLKLSGQMGVGIYKFKPFECEGYWWPGVEVIDPRQFGISPGAATVKDAVYCYWSRPVPTSELKQKFPDSANNIIPDAEVSEMPGKPSGERGTISVQYLATGGVQNMMNMFSGLNRSAKLQTMLTEFYYKDPEIMEIKDQDSLMKWIAMNPGFGSKKFADEAMKQYEMKLAEGPIKVKKYPFGRMILSTRDCVLSDNANPYYRFPFFGTKCYSRPKTFWAKGVCEVVREPVQNYHLLMASLAMNLDYGLRPAYQEMGARSGEAKTKVITTQPNSLMSTSGEIKPIPTGAIAPAGVIEVSEIRRRNWENTSGLSSTLGGVNPVGNYSSVQLEKLMEGAIGKVAPRLRERNRTLEDLGDMKLWFCQNYCTDEREVYFLTEDEIEEIRVNQYTVENESPVIKNDISTGRYKYYVDVDVKRPVSQAARQQQYEAVAKIFAQFSPIAAARLQLESMDFPGKHEVIKLFEKEIAAKQQQDNALKQQQVAVQQQQAADAKSIQERKLDIEEIKAGASSEESVAWIVANLAKAGVPIPPEVMAQLKAIAGNTIEDFQEIEQSEQLSRQTSGSVPGIPS